MSASFAFAAQRRISLARTVSESLMTFSCLPFLTDPTTGHSFPSTVVPQRVPTRRGLPATRSGRGRLKRRQGSAHARVPTDRQGRDLREGPGRPIAGQQLENARLAGTVAN